jgi:hypothetical protein
MRFNPLITGNKYKTKTGTIVDLEVIGRQLCLLKLIPMGILPDFSPFIWC